MLIETQVKINRDRKVSSANWHSDGQNCWAELIKNSDDSSEDRYQFYSELHDDQEAVKADTPLSLADCVLQAHILLGAIPPQSFEAIPCQNQF